MEEVQFFKSNFILISLLIIFILHPVHKDPPSFRLSAFPKNSPTFTLFLIWQFFAFLPSHVPITWSTITLLIQFYSLSLSSTLTPFYLFIFLNPFVSPTLPTLDPTQIDPPSYL